MKLVDLRFYISPFFIGKYYLRRDILNAIAKYKFNGTVFDLGCGQKPYQQFFKHSEKYLGIDFYEYSPNKDFSQLEPDFFFSKDYSKDYLIDTADDSYDHCVSFQVLEHHPEPQTMIKELVRITKKGGLIMISAPFLGGLHEEPNDFQRYTKYQFARLFKAQNCEVLSIIEQGSLFSTIVMLLSEHLNWFAAKNLFAYYVSAIGYIPLLLLMYISLFVDRFVRSNKIFINYLVIAKKNA